MQIYDSLGAPHVATMTYTKTAAAGAWTYAMTVPGADVTGGTPARRSPSPPARCTFDATGKLRRYRRGTGQRAAARPPPTSPSRRRHGPTAPRPATLHWDIVDANNVASLTGFASPSATSSITQNGSAPGAVDNISITGDGTIVATFGAGPDASTVGAAGAGELQQPARGW